MRQVFGGKLFTLEAAARDELQKNWRSVAVHSPTSLSRRVLLDRTHSDFDHVFHGLDPEMLASPPHSLADRLASTSETQQTSDRTASVDLRQILLNIKACRWRHFRPRTLPLHDSDCRHAASRKNYWGPTRLSSAQPGPSPAAPPLKAGGPPHPSLVSVLKFVHGRVC